jgi:hypothetical protein
VNTKKQKTSRFFLKKSTFSVFAFFFAFLGLFPFSEAHAWDAIPAAIYKQTMEKIDWNIKGIIMGALKQQAARIINEQVNKLVGGTVGSGAMFITDWEDFLVREPQRQANTYMNDYLSQITRGRGSSSGYSYRTGYVLGASDSKASEGFFGGKVLGIDEEDPNSPTFEGSAQPTASSDNYYEDLLDTAKAATTERQDPTPTFEGNPSQVFEKGNLRDFNLLLRGTNYPPAFLTSVRVKYREYSYNQDREAFARSIAYHGYLGTTKNGRIVTPGSTIEQTVANAQDIGNKIIAAAQHPEELISSVVANVVNTAIKQGIGTVANMVDRQVNQVTDKALNTVNTSLKSVGPRALYNGSSSSRRY